LTDDDRVRILDMIEAGESISKFIAGRGREDLDADQMLLFAIVHGYFDIDRDIVWNTVEKEVPAVLPASRSAVADRA